MEIQTVIPKSILPSKEQLTDEQLVSLQENIDFCTKPSEDVYRLLQGPAGTGKTFLVNVLVAELVKLGFKVAVTGTTNRAVKVLKAKSNKDLKGVCFSTLHKLFGMYVTYDEVGKELFKAEYNAEHPVMDYDVIMVDESSQLNDSLFEIAAQYSHEKKFIFIGDSYQTPPVNKDDSIPFDIEAQREFKIGVSSLEKIQRQAEGSPIIQLATLIRNNISKEKLPINRQSNEAVTYYIPTQHVELAGLMNTLFNSEEFKKDSDYCKIVAWTNKKVKLLNDKVRSMIYGENAKYKIMPGEKLVANGSIVDHYPKDPVLNDRKSILFTNADEFSIVSYEVKTFQYTVQVKQIKPVLKGADGMQKIVYESSLTPKPFTFNYYECIVEHIVDGDKIKHNKLRIIHESSEHALNQALLLIQSNANRESNREAKVAYWDEKKDLNNQFAYVNYAYALTVHKAQGGTYEHCIVSESDIMSNSRIRDRNRILYTAITRPSNKLYIAYK